MAEAEFQTSGGNSEPSPDAGADASPGAGAGGSPGANADTGRPLPPLRHDLRIARRTAPDGEEFILHDPSGRLFFRLGPHEWAVLRLFDGRRSAARIAGEISRVLPHHQISADEVAAFARKLALAGVLRLPGGGELQRLAMTRKRHWSTTLAAWVGRIFYFRIPLGNPDRLVTHLARRIGPIITNPTLLKAALVMVLLTAAALLWRIDALAAPQVEFLSGSGLLWMLGALLAMKVMHELAHAITCRHFGGRVTEAGVALIIFTPCLYCDVSEAWMMPERRRRMAITAAGMAVELIVAAMAAIIFMLTRPGWLHQAAFSLMIVGSVQTILFNGNPLLRFDGYYLLSDWLEMPNLRLRARSYARELLRRLFWGGGGREDDYQPARHRLLLAVYAVASYIYGWMILYAILGLLHWKLAAWGLQGVAATLIGLTIATQIVLPLYSGGHHLLHLARQRGHMRRFARALAVISLIILLVAAILAIPLDDQVTQPFVLQSAISHDLRSEQPGRIVRVLKAEGDRVRGGEAVILLADESLDLDIERAAGDVAAAEIWRDLARQNSTPVQLAAAERRLAEARAIEQDLRKRRETLTVRADRDGVLTSLPAADQVGLTVPAAALLATVAVPGKFRAALHLTAADARRVPIGAAAGLLLRAAPGEPLKGRVSGNDWKPGRDVHPVFTSPGGEAAPGDSTLSSAGRGIGESGRGSSVNLYRADITVLEAPAEARPGMSGKARIFLGRTNLGRMAWRAVMSQIDLDLLLSD